MRRVGAARRIAVWAASAALLTFSQGCATPIGVRHASERSVYATLTENLLSTGEPSVASRQVMLREGLFDRFAEDPEGALAELHTRTLAETTPDRLFALAEYAEQHAEATRQPAYHLAAAICAYAFLFPEDGGEPPAPFDPRLRTAADLYARALSDALVIAGGPAALTGIDLPSYVGKLDLGYDAQRTLWAGRRLAGFVSASDLEVHGLRNRYRRPGIGAAFVASAEAAPAAELSAKNALVADHLRIPVAFFLRIDSPRGALRQRDLHARLELYNSREDDDVEVAGRRVPLEYETSVALALVLDRAPVWDSEIAGFRRPGLVPANGLLRMWGPHVAGRVPVVFVHGTASSAARWAEMLNELQSDPQLWRNYEFWFFSYPTGNPILYSAGLLRTWLRKAVDTVDPEGRDAALKRMVLIGHSQGGLLCKLQVVSSGDRFWNNLSGIPFEQARLGPEVRELLRNTVFFEPLPFVRSVIFISTPQHGSFLAANWLGRIASSLTSAPGMLAGVGVDLLRAGVALPGAAVDLVRGPGEGKGADDAKLRHALERLPSSVDNMNPNNRFIRTLADLRIEPPVEAHSIIPVTGGPPARGKNDGVVEYTSAHIDDAVSEYVVFHSGHSAQSQPEAIQEVRRILLEQLAATH